MAAQGLKRRLQADLTDAMRARDEVQVATLRMALTAIANAEVAGVAARELTDEEVLSVLAKEAKRRRESEAAFRSAGRTDLADREQAEAEVLAGYLPAPLGDDELAALVAQAVAETAASGPRAMGTVMKALTPQVAGRADGARVAAAVRAALGG